MTAPEAIPWFLVSGSVVVWRLVKSWESWTHLIAFLLAWPSLLLVGNQLSGGEGFPQVALRALGGTMLLTAGYWYFFDKDDATTDDDTVDPQIEQTDRAFPQSQAARLSISLLFGVLVVQTILAVLFVIGENDSLAFSFLYVVHLGATAASAALLLVARTRIRRI
jgi:hypothetical protein